MSATTIVWIVLVIVLVAIVLAVAMRASRGRREEAHRAEAQQLREEAAGPDLELRRREAAADHAAAKAQQAKAEAEQYEAEAEARRQSAAGVRDERDDVLRRADARDPDVETDEDGRRINDGGLDDRTEVDRSAEDRRVERDPGLR
ncbi:hypothetical protein [Nostocoides sp. HKS02]|uniref:hypothetical protein n=1 Tax=Nostocoides sp. HKS02 TaxID=1813880 RepID=UPI0012B466C8|nr:hypothetical protein [Tetrasphaera sp. HKS02]QGN57403.1 hypothetical protein GKE56_05425 [Tetrasphaera sp. HKS02]